MVDNAWRNTYRATAPPIDTSRPTEATFAEAEAAFLDDSRDAADKKFAALKGVPNPVAPDLIFPMRIAARDLTATYSEAVILNSLGMSSQPAILSQNAVHLRDFNVIKNSGISFVCTDREICTKLGNIPVEICNKKFI